MRGALARRGVRIRHGRRCSAGVERANGALRATLRSGVQFTVDIVLHGLRFHAVEQLLLALGFCPPPGNRCFYFRSEIPRDAERFIDFAGFFMRASLGLPCGIAILPTTRFQLGTPAREPRPPPCGSSAWALSRGKCPLRSGATSAADAAGLARRARRRRPRTGDGTLRPTRGEGARSHRRGSEAVEVG